MRRRKIKGALEAYLAYEDYAIAVDEGAKDKLVEFCKEGPLGLEIGTGRGRFIVEMAKRHPQMRFVGVEMKEELLMRAARLATDEGVSNVRFLLADVAKIADLLASIQVDRLYLNFSDPWPKDRHAKRRLSHGNFLTMYRGLLKADGQIVMKTDNPNLYHFSVDSFMENGYVILEKTEDLTGLGDLENVMSEYEAHFVSLNMPIYRIVVSAR